VRENKLHGVDYIKIYTTQDCVGPVHMCGYRLGLKVACHVYGGEGMYSCEWMPQTTCSSWTMRA
jgi:hypothetical protein